MLKSALVQSAETAVGRARHRQPDWFLDSAITLEPTLAQRNDLLPSLVPFHVLRRSRSYC